MNIFSDLLERVTLKKAPTSDNVKIRGWFDIAIRKSNGRIREGRVVHNLITSTGKAGAASRLNGSGAEAAFTYLAVGVGTTAAVTGNTTLETEIVDSGLARVNATASRVTTTVTNDTMQLATTFSVTGTKAVTEAGILNAASVGVLLCRQVFSALNVINGDSFILTYKVQCS